MTNKWNNDYPHKSWTLKEVYDVRENGQSEDETSYETCMMCHHEKIRYVHVISHPDVAEDLLVGCQCAEKLTADYKNPKLREKELRDKANRRNRFLRRKWKISSKGNEYIIINDNLIIIIKDHFEMNKFKVKINNKYGKLSYDTPEQAKLAAFKDIEYLKNKGEWYF